MLTLVTSFILAMGCESNENPTAVIFLNHSGRDLVGDVLIRNEGTKFSPFSCTIFTSEFRKGDPIKSELTDVFSAELLQHDIRLPSSRTESEKNQSLYISINSKSEITAEWHDLSRADHEIHSEAMHRSFMCIPVAFQLAGSNKPGVIRIHQANFQYLCPAISDGSSGHGYITTNSRSTTSLLITLKDDNGIITKIASITDAMLQEWIAEKTNGLSVLIDLESNQATFYKLIDSDPDSYILSRNFMNGSLKTPPKSVVLPLTQSSEHISKIFSN